MHRPPLALLAPLMLLVSYVTASSCLAQQYELHYVGHYAKSGEILIKATKSGFILGELNSCPFLYNEDTKKLTYLCKQGLEKAYDVNELGTVVGYFREGENTIPALWTKSGGTKRISLFSGYVGGEALSINDHAEISGYEYKISSLSGYYYDQNMNGVCDEGVIEGPCYKDTKLAKGFRYTSKAGLKSAFNQSDSHLSVAYSINNSGTILGYISKPNFDNHYADFRLATQKFNKHQTFSGRPQIATSAGWSSVYMQDFSGGSFTKIDLNDKNLGASGDTLYDFSSRKTSVKKFGERFYADRYDYSTSAAISPQGTVASLRNGFPLIRTLSREAVALNCLIPANSQIAPHSTLTAKDLTTQDAGIFQGENIIFQADVRGDNQEKVVFKLVKLPKEKFGLYYSFCPTISLSLRCKNQRTEQWENTFKTRYDQDSSFVSDTTGVAYSPYRDTIFGNYGYVFDLSDVHDGQACELNSKVSSGLIPLPGATLTFATQDTVGELNAPCTAKVNTSVRSSLLGTTTPIVFNAQNEFNRFVIVKSQNPKYYDYTNPTYFRFIVGDATAPKHQTCE